MAAKNKIILTIILSILSIIFVKLNFSEPLDNKELENEFWVSKTHNKTKKNIVFAGDSRVYRGISIGSLKENLSQELSAINLGYSGAGFSQEYIDFVISKINMEAKNKILVLGISPHSLTEDGSKNEHFLSFYKIHSFDIFKGLYLSQYLKHFSPYKPTEYINNSKKNYIHSYNQDGWVASFKIIPDSTRSLASYRNIFASHKVENHIINSLLQKIKKLKNKKVTVLAYRPPSTIGMKHLEDSISGFKEAILKEKLQALGVDWLDFSDNYFESYDGSHLHYKSAEKLSRLIGKKINEQYLVK